MATSRYQAIADTLRAHRRLSTYPVGSRLPSIVELQREFDVPGLNTIRDAQQVLVREQLLRTEQGVGAFVIAQSSPTTDHRSLVASLKSARADLDRAIAYLEDQEGSS
jgi:DNA-binding GntR family transcriptional regulator